MSGGNRGMALVQALVIAAALAGVGGALMLRTGTAGERVQARQEGAALVVALDAGQDLLVRVIGDLPAQAPTGAGQPWMTRDGVEATGGLLSWQVQDLGGRLNLALLAGADTEIAEDSAEVLARLAQAAGLGAEQAESLRARAADWLDPRTPRAVTLAQLVDGLGLDPAAVARLADEVSVAGGQAQPNINAITATGLRARWPELSDAAIAAVIARRREAPFADAEAVFDWAEQTLEGEDMMLMTLDDWDTRSDGFAFTLTARLDSHALSRSGVIQRSGGAASARLVTAETGTAP